MKKKKRRRSSSSSRGRLLPTQVAQHYRLRSCLQQQ
jgi:hypothetical protein